MSVLTPPATIPFHLRATLHFGYAPKDGTALVDYAGVFLRLYDEACGVPFDARRLQENLAAFTELAPQESSSPSAIADPVAVINQLPEAVQPGARALQENLCSLLQRTYPLLPGETIVQEFVSVLTSPLAGCPAGTVVYVRETDRVRIDFLLPVVRFDAATGRESLAIASPAGLSRPQAEPGEGKRLGAPQEPSWNVIQSVATNLAFALPSPEGPFLAAGLSLIFGTLFGGGGASAELQAIEGMIEQAVTAIENFLRGMVIDETNNDVHAFFLWVHQQITTQTDGSSLSLDNLKSTIDSLESTYNFQRGSLFNDLTQVSTEDRVKSNTYVSRDADGALQVLSLTVTALICAQKLIALLSSMIVAQCTPVDGQHYDLTMDADLAQYTGKWIEAINAIEALVNGQGPDPSPGMTLAQATAAYTSEGDVSSVTNVFGASAPAPWGTGNISDYAASHGWAAAIGRLVLHRQMSRVLELSQVTYYDNRSTTCSTGAGGVPICGSGGSDGYQFSDAVDTSASVSQDNHRWTSGCCSQNDHCDSSEDSVKGAWATHYQTLVTSLSATSDTGASWQGDMQVTQQWTDAVSTLYAGAPPQGQPNTLVIGSNGWTSGAQAGSQWVKATAVRYAVSCVNSQGIGQRSDWSMDFPIPAGSWEPNVRCIPAPPSGDARVVTRQIWRQFVFKDAVGDKDVLGVPKVVGSLSDASATEFKDTDHAQDTTGLPAALK